VNIHWLIYNAIYILLLNFVLLIKQRYTLDRSVYKKFISRALAHPTAPDGLTSLIGDQHLSDPQDGPCFNTLILAYFQSGRFSLSGKMGALFSNNVNAVPNLDNKTVKPRNYWLKIRTSWSTNSTSIEREREAAIQRTETPAKGEGEGCCMCWYAVQQYDAQAPKKKVSAKRALQILLHLFSKAVPLVLL
ncbi:hypothetical protein ACJX0J_006156, partial [Zea mays]